MGSRRTLLRSGRTRRVRDRDVRSLRGKAAFHGRTPGEGPGFGESAQAAEACRFAAGPRGLRRLRWASARAMGFFAASTGSNTEDGQMFELVEKLAPNAVIKVIGVGGGGGNAVSHMVNSTIDGVEFICANTDAQALKSSGARTTLQLGESVTKGLGAGANPEIGRQAALEDRDRIVEVLEGADMVFITCGMGGGTGTGAAPVVAQLAKEKGILTVAVVTKPFPFEGRRRMQVAMKGIEDLQQYVDSLITVPNEKLLTVLGREVTLLNAFKAANEVLQGAVQGIADLITRPGLINVDFADVRTVMSEMGMAMMGTGTDRGDDRAQAAAEAAINNPLLENIDLSGACGILVNVTAGPNRAARAQLRPVPKQEEVVMQQRPRRALRTGTGNEVVDYAPQQASLAAEHPPAPAARQAKEAAAAPNMDYLDIPAFLRRQAD